MKVTRQYKHTPKTPKLLTSKIFALVACVLMFSTFALNVFADNGTITGNVIRPLFNLDYIEFPTPSYEITQGVMTAPYNFVMPDADNATPSTSSSSKYYVDSNSFGNTLFENYLTNNNNNAVFDYQYSLRSYIYGQAIDYLLNTESRNGGLVKGFQSVTYHYSNISLVPGDNGLIEDMTPVEIVETLAPHLYFHCTSPDPTSYDNLLARVELDYLFTTESGEVTRQTIEFDTSMTKTGGRYVCDLRYILSSYFTNNDIDPLYIYELSVNVHTPEDSIYTYETYCLQYNTELIPQTAIDNLNLYVPVEYRYQQVINEGKFSNLFDYLGRAIGGFMDTPVFAVGNLNVTFAMIFGTSISLLLIFAFLRFFSGG